MAKMGERSPRWSASAAAATTATGPRRWRRGRRAGGARTRSLAARSARAGDAQPEPIAPAVRSSKPPRRTPPASIPGGRAPQPPGVRHRRRDGHAGRGQDRVAFPAGGGSWPAPRPPRPWRDRAVAVPIADRPPPAKVDRPSFSSAASRGSRASCCARAWRARSDAAIPGSTATRCGARRAWPTARWSWSPRRWAAAGARLLGRALAHRGPRPGRAAELDDPAAEIDGAHRRRAGAAPAVHRAATQPTRSAGSTARPTAARHSRRCLRRGGERPLRRRRRARFYVDLPARLQRSAAARGLPVAAVVERRRAGRDGEEAPRTLAVCGTLPERRDRGARERAAVRRRSASRTKGRPVSRPARQPRAGGNAGARAARAEPVRLHGGLLDLRGRRRRARDHHRRRRGAGDRGGAAELRAQRAAAGRGRASRRGRVRLPGTRRGGRRALRSGHLRSAELRAQPRGPAGRACAPIAGCTGSAPR